MRRLVAKLRARRHSSIVPLDGGAGLTAPPLPQSPRRYVRRVRRTDPGAGATTAPCSLCDELRRQARCGLCGACVTERRQAARNLGGFSSIETRSASLPSIGSCYLYHRLALMLAVRHVGSSRRFGAGLGDFLSPRRPLSPAWLRRTRASAPQPPPACAPQVRRRDEPPPSYALLAPHAVAPPAHRARVPAPPSQPPREQRPPRPPRRRAGGCRRRRILRSSEVEEANRRKSGSGLCCSLRPGAARAIQSRAFTARVHNRERRGFARTESPAVPRAACARESQTRRR